jgi:hypothetical protein
MPSSSFHYGAPYSNSLFRRGRRNRGRNQHPPPSTDRSGNVPRGQKSKNGHPP